MVRSNIFVPTTIAAAVLLACLAALLAASGKAEAAFPGQNGRIAYDGEGGIWSGRPDGTGSRIVVPDGADGEISTSPAYAPHGRRIAYQARRSDGNAGQSWEVFVAKADGTGVVRLTNNPAEDTLPAWSPDGKRIAFVSDRGGSYDIWAMDPDGTNLKNLTNSPSRSDFQPSWSPDGMKITFDTNQLAGDVWVMDADGTDQRNLTPTPFVGEYEPTFSPDGKKIAYARAPRRGSEPSDIYKMRASDGLARTEVTDTPAREGTPDWGQKPPTSP